MRVVSQQRSSIRAADSRRSHWELCREHPGAVDNDLLWKRRARNLDRTKGRLGHEVVIQPAAFPAWYGARSLFSACVCVDLG